MTCKHFISCILGLMSVFITNQVESYNFRSANRSMTSVETQRNKRSEKKISFEQIQELKPKSKNNLVYEKMNTHKHKSLIDNRGRMPHERGEIRRNTNFNQRSLSNTSEKLESYQRDIGIHSDESSQSLEKNWRFQGSTSRFEDKILNNFRPKGNNLNMVVVPYKGEFYNRGGKPFSIDTGLLGRWK